MVGGPIRRWAPRLVLVAALLPALPCLLPAPAPRAQVFGQNRVAAETRSWRLLRGEHVDLHFHDEEQEVAAEALRLAERAFQRLSLFHGHTPSRRIPILLYSSQSEFSETPVVSSPLGEGVGGLTESFKRRVIVPATGSLAELDHVLTHEMEHAFQFDMLAGGGPGSQGLRWIPPLWVLEGLCEYLSVPGLDADTEMWLRDAAASGELIDLDDLALVGDLRVYRFGQAVIAYIAERFGDEGVALWWRAIVRRRSLERGTAESIGLTLDKLSDGWREWARRRYLPDYGLAVGPEQEGRPLTDHRRSLANFHVAPALSPDGGEVVFIADQAPYADIFLASAIDGSRRRRLIRGAREESFESLRFYRSTLSWHPGGDRLALIAKSGGRDRLTIFHVRSRRVEASYDFGLDEMISPAWSPDGARLVFVGQRGGRSDLYRVDADGGGIVALTADGWAALQPAWSPDGALIAFVTDEGYVSRSPSREAPLWRIAILDSAGGERRLLPGAGSKNLNPQWFPDGRHLLYTSDRDGIANLFVHDLETGADYKLTNLRNGASGLTPNSAAASLSADGRRLVFSAYREGGWDLYAITDPLARLAGASPWAAATPAAGAASAAAADSVSAPSAAAADSLVETAPKPAPLALAALYAATSSAGDSASAEELRYRPRLTVDFVQAGGLYASGFGAVAQTVVGLSDMLGDRQLLLGADVSGSLEEGNYYVGYLNQRRRPFLSFAAYQFMGGYGYSTVPGYPEIYLKRLVRGVGAGVQYPLSRFRRLELSVDAVHETRFRWACDAISGTNIWLCGWEGEEDAYAYLAPEVAFVHDTALFGSTGPLSGRRSRLSAGAFVGERRAHGLEADYRFYWNVRKRYAFALRGVFAGEWGRDRERMAFGGPYSLRGYTQDPLYGTSLAFANLEFRFPFIEGFALAWPLRLGIYGIRGALFCDFGAAWDDPADFRALRSGRGEGSFRLEDVRASCGLRAAVNLGFMILRWDLSRRTDLAGWVGKAAGEVSIGAEF